VAAGWWTGWKLEDEGARTASLERSGKSQYSVQVMMEQLNV
jgi:hypothetical protein